MVLFQKGTAAKGSADSPDGEEKMEDKEEGEASGNAKTPGGKARTKGTPPGTKGKPGKKKTNAAAGEEDEEGSANNASEKPTEASPKRGRKPLKKKMKKGGKAGPESAGEQAKEGAGKASPKKQATGALKGKKGTAPQAAKVSQGQHQEDSSEEDDIPLLAIAKTHKVLLLLDYLLNCLSFLLPKPTRYCCCWITCC